MAAPMQPPFQQTKYGDGYGMVILKKLRNYLFYCGIEKSEFADYSMESEDGGAGSSSVFVKPIMRSCP